MNKTKVTYKDEEDYIANCYLFAHRQSVSTKV